MRLPGFLEAQFSADLLLCDAVPPSGLASWRGVCAMCVGVAWRVYT